MLLITVNYSPSTKQMTHFRHSSGVFMPRTLANEGIIMETEREALRLSAMIALCVGVFIVVLSIDNFEQRQGPTYVGDVQCTWWSSTMQGCKTVDRSLSQVTQRSRGLAFSL